MKKLALWVVTGLTLVCLLGCGMERDYVKAPIHVPIDLLEDDYEAQDVAVGITDTGTIYMGMSVCPRPPSIDTYCKFSYFQPQKDNQWFHLEFSVAGHHMREPDVTVTDNGTGFISVWQQLIGSNSQDRYFRTDTLGLYYIWGGGPDPILYYTKEPPKIASNGNIVYIVSVVEDPSTFSIRLRYRKIWEGGEAYLSRTGWVSPLSGTAKDYTVGQGFNIAVSPDGDLYVVWKNAFGIYTTNNRGTDGNMPTPVTVYELGNLSIPSISVSDSVAEPYLWIAFVDYSPEDHTDSDDLLLYNCDTTDCAGTDELYFTDLTSTQHWDVRNEPKVIGVQHFAYIAFSADNDTAPGAPNGHDIYLLDYNTDTNLENRTQINNDNVGDTTPVMTLVEDYPVIAWRQMPSSDGYRDVFMYDPRWEVRKVYMSESGLADMDIAANGEYAVGAWLEEEWVPTPIRVDMYYTYNSLATYLPFLTVP
jgi:hypothetical protein